MERRLAAILVIDMVGYSRLMAADESGTIDRQKRHREPSSIRRSPATRAV